MGVYWTSMPIMGNGACGSGSGEKALETAFRSMDCSSYENFPMRIARESEGDYVCRALLGRAGAWATCKGRGEDQVEGKPGASSRKSDRSHVVL